MIRILLYSSITFLGLIAFLISFLTWRLVEKINEVKRLEGLLDKVSNDIKEGSLIRKLSDKEIERLR